MELTDGELMQKNWNCMAKLGSINNRTPAQESEWHHRLSWQNGFAQAPHLRGFVLAQIRKSFEFKSFAEALEQIRNQTQLKVKRK